MDEVNEFRGSEQDIVGRDGVGEKSHRFRDILAYGVDLRSEERHEFFVGLVLVDIGKSAVDRFPYHFSVVVKAHFQGYVGKHLPGVCRVQQQHAVAGYILDLPVFHKVVVSEEDHVKSRYIAGYLHAGVLLEA